MKLSQTTFILLLTGTLSYCNASGTRGGKTGRQLQSNPYVPVATFRPVPADDDDDEDEDPDDDFIVPVEDPETDVPEPEDHAIDAKNDYYETEQDKDLKVYKPGVLENDGGGPGDLFAKEVTVPDIFQGYVEIREDGKLYYYVPDAVFFGREIFEYTACLKDFPDVCDKALVTIDVKKDPHRPDSNPVAIDDELDVDEGETVKVLAPGILANDLVGTPSNHLRVCSGYYRGRRLEHSDSDDWDIRGELDLDKDGGFTYTAPKCFVGAVQFEYKACYEDYKDMESNTATVTINVEKARPHEPDADSDKYEVKEGDKLDVPAKYGLLSNDGVDKGYHIYVKDYTKKYSHYYGSFKGDLEVFDDGSFHYTPEPAELGTFTFEYEICIDGWEHCVHCDKSTVEIKVLENPEKPDEEPSANDKLITTPLGAVLEDNVKDYIDYVTSLSLTMKGYTKSNGFKGILNTESDGDFEYGNAPPGNESFTYEFCYTKFSDLCGKGNITLQTVGIITSVEKLEEKGNNGDPESAFPLSECEADCDKDEDCKGDLICFQREDTEVIPGCYGVDGNTFKTEDFCIEDPNPPESEDEVSTDTVSVNRQDPSFEPVEEEPAEEEPTEEEPAEEELVEEPTEEEQVEEPAEEEPEEEESGDTSLLEPCSDWSLWC